jgi:hypothetical protein
MGLGERVDLVERHPWPCRHPRGRIFRVLPDIVSCALLALNISLANVSQKG